MDIVLYPDPRLRAPNDPVQEFGPELQALARDMFEAMYRTEGVGLAAPQVGVNVKLLVFNPTGDPEARDQERVLCNPRIVRSARERAFGREGCLSFPGIFAEIERPVAVTIEALDLRGRPFTLELSDWEARIFQHEFDHLEGVLFIDRMRPVDKATHRAALEELAAAYREQRVAHPERTRGPARPE